MNKQQALRQARHVTIIGAIVNLILGGAKCVFGVIGHSQALIADGLHSISDLLTDGLVLVATHYGNQDADSNHPYGHGRIETAATMLLALVLIFVGVGIGYDAGDRLFSDEKMIPDMWVIWVVIISLVTKEVLYQYTKLIADKIDSPLLHANAWHHRSDAFSSVVVLIGVLGSLFGWYYLDDIAAIIVGLMIIKMGWQLAWSSVQELIDTAVEPEMLENIEKIIQQVPGVDTIHQLRTRSMGGSVLVDVHVQVNSYLSVSEGHHIAQVVHYSLVKQIKEITDVTVHIDPEDDEVAAPSFHLPNRKTVMQILKQHWQSLLPELDSNHIRLHYLNGKIEIEVRVSIDQSNNMDKTDLQQQLTTALTNDKNIGSVTVLFF